MNTPLFDKYLSHINYNDAFGHNSIWNQEVEKWLESIDLQYLEQNKRRFGKAGREKQRDNFLAELCVNYFLQKKLGWKLNQLTPLGTKLHELEFLFTDTCGVLWYCEVKNSSWENEVMSGKESLETKKHRIKEPKYKNGDGRSFSLTDSYVEQIRKATNQFQTGKNNLLVIIPDTFVSPLIDPFLDDNVWTNTPIDSPITAVGFLEYNLSSDESEVVYNWKLINFV